MLIAVSVARSSRAFSGKEFPIVAAQVPLREPAIALEAFARGYAEKIPGRIRNSAKLSAQNDR
jgi:hypothetical protein